MKILRYILLALLLFSVGLFLTSLRGASHATSQNGLHFRPETLVVRDVLCTDSAYDFQIEVVNDTSKTARLLGVGEYCLASCFGGRGLPVEIKPGAIGRVGVHIAAGDPGKFDQELTFYTDCPSQPALTLRLQGTVRDDRPSFAKLP